MNSSILSEKDSNLVNSWAKLTPTVAAAKPAKTSPPKIPKTEEDIFREKQLLEKGVVNLIDGDGRFSTFVPEFIHKNGLANAQIDYSILSVLGPQSSGKSTLLNLLFGADFTVMDSTQGRYQVTLGVVGAKAKDQNTIIMDLEGTDSKEREERGDSSFERKISLFALAMSEVILINMWMVDIGRYTASNYALLKIIFELNLQLFQKHNNQNKTLLYFVVRDSIQNLGPLEKMIKHDIENEIWGKLSKPEEFKDAKVTDFFDFQFFALPHKVLQPEEFKAATDVLKQHFYNPQDPKYAFLQKYKRQVPIDSFSRYAAAVWQTILENKDLDIPTQKEMVALFRCGEIAREEILFFENQFGIWKKQVEEQHLFVPNFGKSSEELVQSVIKKFEHKTALYDQKIVASQALELREKMIQRLSEVFKAQVELAKQNGSTSFEKLLDSAVSTCQDGILADFDSVISKISEKVFEFFKDAVEKARYPFANPEEKEKQKLSWSSSVMEAQLKQDIEKKIAIVRDSQIEKILQFVIEDSREALTESVSPILNDPPTRGQNASSMWAKLREIEKKEFEEASEDLKKSLENFKPSQTEIKEMEAAIKEEFINVIKDNVAIASGYISLKMHKKFEEMFKFEQNEGNDGEGKGNANVPRVWKPTDDVKKAFLDAREESLFLLDTFFLWRFENQNLEKIHLSFGNAEFDLSSSFRYPQRVVRSSLASPSNVSSTGVNPSNAFLSTASSGSPFSPSREKRFAFSQIEEIYSDKDIVIDEKSCRSILDSFCLRIENAYTEAKREQKLNENKTAIPIWVWGIVLVLGGDKILWLFRNPLYFFFIVAVGVIVGWSYIQRQIEKFLKEGNKTYTIPIRIFLSQLPFQIIDLERIERLKSKVSEKGQKAQIDTDADLNPRQKIVIKVKEVKKNSKKTFEDEDEDESDHHQKFSKKNLRIERINSIAALENEDFKNILNSDNAFN